jgi:hypothetical protein
MSETGQLDTYETSGQLYDCGSCKREDDTGSEGVGSVEIFTTS